MAGLPVPLAGRRRLFLPVTRLWLAGQTPPSPGRMPIGDRRCRAGPALVEALAERQRRHRHRPSERAGGGRHRPRPRGHRQHATARRRARLPAPWAGRGHRLRRLAPLLPPPGRAGAELGGAARAGRRRPGRGRLRNRTAEPTASGGAYRWRTPVPALPEMPDWLIDALARRPSRELPPHRAEPGRIDRDLSAWARTALLGEAHRVRTAPMGQRNHTLNRAAFSLGQIVGTGVLAEDTVERVLSESAVAAGLGDSESIRTIRSGLSAGRQRPRGPAERHKNVSAAGIKQDARGGECRHCLWSLIAWRRRFALESPEGRRGSPACRCCVRPSGTPPSGRGAAHSATPTPSLVTIATTAISDADDPTASRNTCRPSRIPVRGGTSWQAATPGLARPSPQATGSSYRGRSSP